ncbi:MAG: hypothetical protein ACE5GW_03750 [Planctomycetota bacterium]
MRPLHACALVVLLLGSPLPAASGSGGDDEDIPSFVGKKLPHMQIERWYVGEPLNFGSLRGHPWVFVLAKLTSPTFEQIRPLLESIHRPTDKGGPFVVVFTKEPQGVVEKALRQMKKKPPFPIAGDRRFLTHLKLKVDRFPYLYLVNPDQLVAWQGVPGPEMGPALDRLQRIARRGGKGKRREQPPPSGPGKGEKETGRKDGEPTRKPKPPSLPKDFPERCEKALKRGSIADRSRLLAQAWPRAEPPKNRLLRRLWDALSKDLDKESGVIEKRIDGKRYGAARSRLKKSSEAFGRFAPARSLRTLWARLAEEEGGRWLERAEEARAAGDRETARKELERVIKIYKGSKVAERARVLLTELEEEERA